MSVVTPPNSGRNTPSEGRRARFGPGNLVGNLTGEPPVGNNQKAIRIAMALAMAGTIFLVAEALPPGDAVLATAAPGITVPTSDIQAAVPAAGDGSLADTNQDSTTATLLQPQATTPADPAVTTASSAVPETTVTTAAATTTAAPAPADPAPAAPAPAPDASAAQEVLHFTNRNRTEGGCGELTLDAQLSQAAQAHSDDMAVQNYFDHTSLDGRSPWDRASAAGTSARAENIARGQPTAENVVAGWMNSPGHRANIMNCGLTRLGVGLSASGNYWTQLFG